VAGISDGEFQRVVQEVSAAGSRREARKVVAEAGWKKGQFSSAQMEQLTDIYSELPGE
jgi:hypothetical protein